MDPGRNSMEIRDTIKTKNTENKAKETLFDICPHAKKNHDQLLNFSIFCPKAYKTNKTITLILPLLYELPMNEPMN